MSDEPHMGMRSTADRERRRQLRRLTPVSALTVEQLREDHAELVARVAQLERELGQERRMQRRVAELVDIVQQVVAEQASQDGAARERLEAYLREA